MNNPSSALLCECGHRLAEGHSDAVAMTERDRPLPVHFRLGAVVAGFFAPWLGPVGLLAASGAAAAFFFAYRRAYTVRANEAMKCFAIGIVACFGFGFFRLLVAIASSAAR